jgi:hypothetical protein
LRNLRKLHKKSLKFPSFRDFHKFRPCVSGIFVKITFVRMKHDMKTTTTTTSTNNKSKTKKSKGFRGVYKKIQPRFDYDNLHLKDIITNKN